ncbi:MAG: hypothetical protein KXJ50_07830 [Vulcanococcus sp.]|uniref:hypothetical protein n=1 Tax=Vulcanococcus sp. TaxID=2856995 RepID=UPI0025F62D0A|nr:hypothetical protein [Vulcanococcus sp.]MBW0180957.1 hypothetical protein [Vulcanococcus sp.]
MGIARHGQNRLEDAMATYLPVLASGSRPACFEDIVLQYGLASLELGLASHWLRLIDRLDADSSLGPRVLYLKGLACLGLGDYAMGWKYHEHRFSAGCSEVAELSLPFWSGEHFSPGHHLLLLGEQGYGDVIQFMRFAPRLRRFFERVSILVPSPLRRLVQASGLFDFVVSSPSDLPHGVTHALSLLSVPHRLSIHDPFLFFADSYLRVDPVDISFWRQGSSPCRCDQLARQPRWREPLVQSS